MALPTALIAGAAYGAEFSVGSDAACDFADLDDAIAAASGGDTLRLKAETFVDVITIDRSLDLIGGHSNCGDTNPTLGQASTIQNPLAGTSPIVSITGTSTAASLSRITIEGANSSGNGGGIYLGSHAALDLAQVVVRNNEATNGAGIYVDQNANLTTNSALTLSIVDNTASGVGGGIYVGSGASIDLVASIVDISDNTANNSGGGIFASGNADIALVGATVSGNSSTTSQGGGLYSGPGVADVTISISDSTFENNASAASNGGGLMVSGNSGADKQLNISNSEIISNTADANGGGLYLAGTLTTELTDTTVDSNTAGGNGGGIHALGADGWLMVERSTITNNSANDDGGGVWTQIGNAHFTGEFGNRTIIEDNSAAHGGGVFVAGPGGEPPEFASPYFNSHTRVFGNTASDGAGIYLNSSGGHFLLFRGHAAQNQATGDGGGFALHGSGKLHFNTARVSQNSASGNGGGIHATAGEIMARNSGISRNGASNGSGVFLQEASLLYDDSWLVNNNADADGGGIHAAGSGDIELVNSQVSANSAGSKGGGIYRTGSGRLTMSASMVSDTVDPRGVTTCDPSTLDANRYCSEVFDNTASQGGGIYIQASTQEVSPHRIEHTAFSNNSGDQGSALTLSDAFDVWVKVSLFAQNSDAGDDEVASVIHVVNDSELLIEDTTIADNSETALVLLTDSGTVHNIYRNILWDNAGDFIGGNDLVIDNQCNMSQDNSLPGAQGQPAFIATARGNYRLSDLSDALDYNCGDPAGVDLDGVTRPVGDHNDLGAFEGAWGHPDFLFSDRFEG